MCAQVPVQSESELVACMRAGFARRAVAATGMNAASSRSHCLVQLLLQRHAPDGSCTRGKLCLVDLAGAADCALCRQSCVGSSAKVMHGSFHSRLMKELRT